MTVSSAEPKPQCTERLVEFTTADGRHLNLINVRGTQAPSKSPVLLVHGAGVRANIFRAPVQTSVVDALIEAGFDVWLENWRASIDFEANEWTLDQAALFDHPAAVEKVIEETGNANIKAIIHCQGSTSFMMSAVAGLVPQVTDIVSNAVSLHPIVPPWSKFKLLFLLPIVSLMTKYLNPHWGVKAPTWQAKLINLMVKATHHECDNAVCKHVNFTYGSGFPALWRHENLNQETHEWLKEEFKAVPLRFFKQITQCIKAGHLLAVEGFSELPADFTQKEPKTDARFTFFAGMKNLCFLPDSQVKTFHYFDRLQPNRHTLHLLEDYGHLDVFMGKNAAQDVFPAMIEALDRGSL